MSIILNGDQSHVGNLSATVTAISSGTGGVMRVTTSSAHFFGPADYVFLLLSISSSPVSLYGFIIVIDATHFDVAGTTFTATGTGFAFDLSLSPPLLAPTDGDSGSLQLSGMLSALMSLADRTQYLQYKAIQAAIQTQRAIKAMAFVGLGGTALEQLTAAGSGPSLTVGGTTLFGAPSTVATVGAPANAISGTTVTVTVNLDWDMGTHAHPAWLTCYATLGGGSPVEIPGARYYCPDGVTSTRTRATMTGQFQASGPGAVVVTLYAFLGASDVWGNLGGGSMLIVQGPPAP